MPATSTIHSPPLPRCPLMAPCPRPSSEPIDAMCFFHAVLQVPGLVLASNVACMWMQLHGRNLVNASMWMHCTADCMRSPSVFGMHVHFGIICLIACAGCSRQSLSPKMQSSSLGPLHGTQMTPSSSTMPLVCLAFDRYDPQWKYAIFAAHDSPRSCTARFVPPKSSSILHRVCPISTPHACTVG